MRQKATRASNGHRPVAVRRRESGERGWFSLLAAVTRVRPLAAVNRPGVRSMGKPHERRRSADHDRSHAIPDVQFRLHLRSGLHLRMPVRRPVPVRRLAEHRSLCRGTTTRQMPASYRRGPSCRGNPGGTADVRASCPGTHARAASSPWSCSQVASSRPWTSQAGKGSDHDVPASSGRTRQADSACCSASGRNLVPMKASSCP